VAARLVVADVDERGGSGRVVRFGYFDISALTKT